MKTGFLTRLNILIASAVLTLTVGAANAAPLRGPAMTPDKPDNIPVELALVFMFLAFVAGYGFRAIISHVHRAMTGRDGHIDWDVASENFSHIPTAPLTGSAAVLRTQFWKIAQIQELRPLANANARMCFG
jgi:hypothetical protein